MSQEVVLAGRALTPHDVEAVARAGARVRIAPGAVRAMERSRRVVAACLGDGEAHYGINTGFGSLSQRRIEGDDLRALQRNLVRSHAAGVGPPLPRDIVRATMVVLAASLARGLSGVRPAVARRIVDLLNDGRTPRVPEIGSVGASGDLAPLAHIALALIGEGGFIEGPRRRVSAAPPLVLEAKEGLALINGTHLMAGRAALLLADFQRLFAAAHTAAAMSIDACRATDAFLDPRVYAARNQPGPAAAAARLRALLRGSRIIPSHREGDPRVQDPYSLRCAAVVLGAAGDAASFFEQAVERELGAVTDNPLVFTARAGEPIVSAGNFHGMPIAIPLDVLAVALSHVAGIAERRVFYMLAAPEPEMRLTPFLSPRPGLHSGLMIAQYTAAACCNELVGLAGPASVANIPTSSGMEDYNSFGPRAAAKAQRALELARWVVAIELLCAAEGVESHRPLASGAGVEQAIAAVRRRVKPIREDRPLNDDIQAIADLIRSGHAGLVSAPRAR